MKKIRKGRNVTRSNRWTIGVCARPDSPDLLFQGGKVVVERGRAPAQHLAVPRPILRKSAGMLGDQVAEPYQQRDGREQHQQRTDHARNADALERCDKWIEKVSGQNGQQQRHHHTRSDVEAREDNRDGDDALRGIRASREPNVVHKHD
jgi:hypothetical protein